MHGHLFETDVLEERLLKEIRLSSVGLKLFVLRAVLSEGVYFRVLLLFESTIPYNPRLLSDAVQLLGVRVTRATTPVVVVGVVDRLLLWGQNLLFEVFAHKVTAHDHVLLFRRELVVLGLSLSRERPNVVVL